MKRYEVESSNLKQIGYDVIGQLLEVTFNSGDVYEYTQVPPAVAGELLFSTSAGSYLNKVIKSAPALYPYRKVADARAVVSPAQVYTCPDCQGTRNPACTTCLGFGMIPARPAPSTFEPK